MVGHPSGVVLLQLLIDSSNGHNGIEVMLPMVLAVPQVGTVSVVATVAKVLLLFTNSIKLSWHKEH
jgi:hypothetical protein